MALHARTRACCAAGLACYGVVMLISSRLRQLTVVVLLGALHGVPLPWAISDDCTMVPVPGIPPVRATQFFTINVG